MRHSLSSRDCAVGMLLVAVLLFMPGPLNAQDCSCGFSCDLELSSQTITATETHSACLSILAGPAFEMTGTADVQLRAGESIGVLSEFSVESGATLRFSIDPTLFCDFTADQDNDSFDACLDCNDSDPAINPDANDDPDNLFTDGNCDGIDGNVSNAIFVAPNGSDSNSGTMESPMRTIQAGLDTANGTGKDVYVAVGNYTGETLTLHDGVSLYGGYDEIDWSRSDTPGADFSSSMATAAMASDFISQTTIDRVTLRAAGGTSPDASSYGLIVTGSTGLALNRVAIHAGSGANGTDGLSPSNRAMDGDAGEAGGPGCEESSACGTTCNRPIGGAAGNNAACPSANGGAGGPAGLGANDGMTGSSSETGTSGGPGTPSGNGDWETPLTYAGSNGFPGSDGSIGNNGAAAYSMSGYVPQDGTDGSTGTPGDGGGGGGGGGGGTSFCDSYGGGGGGGGAGGCGGLGGGGGTSGGGSFGVYLWDSDVELTDCDLSTGNGGDGGAGGIGQDGGLGGDGGRCLSSGTSKGNCYGGSNEQDDGSNGGRGGDGGDGGNGGHGGGGSGGPSVGILIGGTSTASFDGCVFTLGTGGAGGPSPGASGPDGVQQMTLTPP